MTLLRPIAGVVTSIAITASMDASGLTAFSAMPLFPLLALFWYLDRFSRDAMGFVWGRRRDYGLAAMYPATVIGAAVAIAALGRATHLAGANWQKAGINLVLIATATVIVAIVTEEGFFRGWLWASLVRAGLNSDKVLIWTSIAFALWHVSFATLAKGFELPPLQAALFILNAAAIGAIWGLLRSISGSIVVSSVSHGLWNGAAYALFGAGAKVGALGVVETAIYGPEVGVTGLGLNLLFLSSLWWWSKTQHRGPLGLTMSS